MKFAAGLTVSGIVGFIILEALKILMPPVTVWVIGVLAFLLKAFLIMIVLGIVIGLGIFFYRRQQKAATEV
jgi:type II secretory pathway component PulF